MESSIAKAYSKRLLREVCALEPIGDMLGAPETYHSLSLSKRNLLYDRICARPHVSLFNRMSFGKKAKKYLCFSHFDDASYHPGKDREEDFLVCLNQILSSSPASRSLGDDRVSFVITKHAVERFFLRSAMPSGSPYERYQGAFIEECEPLNFFETIFVSMVANIFADRHESEISRNSVGLSLFLPTQSGAFLAEAYGPTLDIRTYLDEADLTVEQSAARTTLLPIAMAFSRTPIHHYYSNLAANGLLSLHADWSWELFRHCINHDAAAFIDAMFWTQDDWLSFSLKKCGTKITGMRPLFRQRKFYLF